MPLILVCVALYTVGFSQQKLGDILPLQNGKVVYEGVVKLDSVTRDEAYKRAKRWMVRVCHSFYLDDQEELIGKRYITPGGSEVWQTISIQVKEGRYKYTITDFRMRSITILQGSFVRPTEVPIEEAPLIGKTVFLNQSTLIFTNSSYRLKKV